LNAREVKNKARALGADLAGIADAETVRRHPAPGCPHTPADILPGARSIVVVARRLLSGMSREVDPRNRNVHYAGEMILSAVEALTYELGRFLEDHGHPSLMLPSAYSRSHQVDVAAKTLSLPHLAVEAGLGTLGLNLQLLTPELGPRVVLGAVLTRAPLDADSIREQALCEGEECGRCLLACPGDAVGQWALDLERCRPHSSPYGYHFLEQHLERMLAAPEKKSRFEVMRHPDTLMIWQSMLRGVGIYSGCTRCYDVCPVGADYDAHLRSVQEEIAEATDEKRERLARMRVALPAGLRDHARWIGLAPGSS
jgi:epoxyqueuosine reductase